MMPTLSSLVAPQIVCGASNDPEFGNMTTFDFQWSWNDHSLRELWCLHCLNSLTQMITFVIAVCHEQKEGDTVFKATLELIVVHCVVASHSGWLVMVRHLFECAKFGTKLRESEVKCSNFHLDLQRVKSKHMLCRIRKKHLTSGCTYISLHELFRFVIPLPLTWLRFDGGITGCNVTQSWVGLMTDKQAHR